MNQPWLPRLHLFEIDDQPWWPSFLRACVQTNLSHVWTASVPPFLPKPAATLVASTLREVLGSSLTKYTYIDFCSGSGGPTPFIEREVNRHIYNSKKYLAPLPENGYTVGNDDNDDGSTTNGNREAARIRTYGEKEEQGVDFILTDIYPETTSWERWARESAHLWYVPKSVNAAKAPRTEELLQYSSSGDEKSEDQDKKTRLFRTFHLSFHHFDDEMARAILKDTVEGSDGIAIFELQSRDLWSFVPCALSGFFAIFAAPFQRWTSPLALLFVLVIPLVPIVLILDGFVSCLRTRTPDEIEELLRTCGAKGCEDWTVTSGRRRFLWPCGFLNWVICTKNH